MNTQKELVVNNTEEKIPITFNQTLPVEKLTFIKKLRNAWKMIVNQGFGPFWFKVRRRIHHKKQTLIRELFHPNSGTKLRETAKKYFLDNNRLPTLSIVVTVLGQHDMTRLCLTKLIENQIGKTEIVIMDGGGDFEIKEGDLPNKPVNIKIIRDKETFPAWQYWMEQTTGDIMLFMHNDIIIDDYGFDVVIRYLFEQNEKMGLLGFVGSDEMNANGSRGWGTTSNFLGRTYSHKDRVWSGASAEILGRRYDGFSPSVFIDGCVMGMRRSAWNKLGYHKDQSMYHYYDRLMCCRFMEAGFTIGTLGVACDHLSNQTASQEIKWHKNVKALGEKNNIPTITDATGNVNWDMSIHAETKRRFLKEWRDEKHFIPLVIND